MLAEAATYTTADMAGNVHLSRRLREGEVTGTQTDFRIGTEELTGESQQHLFQVGETHVLIDIETFYLVEEAMGTGCDGLIAIYASGTNNANRCSQLTILSVHLLHDASLDAGGV